MFRSGIIVSPTVCFRGKRGIRTPEPVLPVTRFPGVPLQPLEHLSLILWVAKVDIFLQTTACLSLFFTSLTQIVIRFRVGFVCRPADGLSVCCRRGGLRQGKRADKMPTSGRYRTESPAIGMTCRTRRLDARLGIRCLYADDAQTCSTKSSGVEPSLRREQTPDEKGTLSVLRTVIYLLWYTFRADAVSETDTAMPSPKCHGRFISPLSCHSRHRCRKQHCRAILPHDGRRRCKPQSWLQPERCRQTRCRWSHPVR